jgi:hypothetical protein
VLMSRRKLENRREVLEKRTRHHRKTLGAIIAGHHVIDQSEHRT